MLSRRFSLSLFVFSGALLLAGSVSALTLDYSVTGTMAMQNQTCTLATCTVAVTGTMQLDDDGVGNVSLTGLNLSHAGYEVASPALVSIVIARSSILGAGSAGAGSVAGTGSTLGAVLFGSTTLAQYGTLTCTSGLFTCAVAGLPADGTYPLGPNPDPSPTALGTWTFDPLTRNLLNASFNYTNTVTPQPALEVLTLTAALVPEPGTGLLMAVGLIGMALRRRAVR